MHVGKGLSTNFLPKQSASNLKGIIVEYRADCCMHILVPDIPDDEAQYWTGKLKHINTMEIHDEVKCNKAFILHSCIYFCSNRVFKVNDY